MELAQQQQAPCPHLQGVPEKIAQSLRITSQLELYVTRSCGFQQNVQKEIVYMIKAS